MDPRWLLICEDGHALSLSDDGHAVRCSDDAACGCAYYLRARSCEGIAYDPPASEVCPALPDVYVCNNIAPIGTTFAYHGTCYTVLAAGQTEPPQRAVKIDDPDAIDIVDDCYDARCNSNRFFYKATPCAGENNLAPDFYVCVAGVPFDCKIFRYQVDASNPEACYRLDRSTPIDEDDIPGGAARVPSVETSFLYDRCCECIAGCQTQEIITAPCAAPNVIPTTRCCCNLTSERVFTYTFSQVRTEGRDGFAPFWSKDTYTTTTPAVITCHGDGSKVVTPGTMTHRFQYPNGGTDETTNEVLNADIDCTMCHPPTFAFTAPDGSANCSGTYTVGDARYDWDYDIANRCFSSFRRAYDKLTDTDTPADYVETLTTERWSLVTTGNERCTGGCDGYVGADLRTMPARTLALIARGR